MNDYGFLKRLKNKREKKMKSFRVSFMIVAVLSWGFMFETASAKPAHENKKVISLSKQEVDKCVKVLPIFIKEFPDFNPMKSQKGKPAEKNNITDIVAGDKLKKLDAFSVKHGYKNFNDFARNFTGIMSAYMYFKTLEAKKMFDLQAKDLPPEVAALMATQMKPINANLEKLKKKVSPELLEAVESQVSKIDGIFGIKMP